MAKYQIDELDRKIMELLSEDARLSNRNIAQSLSVTEGTVRSRVKRLENESYIRITAVTNMGLLDKPQLVYIGIHAEQSMIKQVAAEIAEFDEVNAVIILLGRFDILAIGLFSDLQELQSVVSDKLLALAGVRHIETTVVVSIAKYNNRLAKIIAPQIR
jgi:Lrp/AsnC family transcriptional regulator, regulator for asnA, asnC and gidA